MQSELCLQTTVQRSQARVVRRQEPDPESEPERVLRHRRDHDQRQGEIGGKGPVAGHVLRRTWRISQLCQMRRREKIRYRKMDYLFYLSL